MQLYEYLWIIVFIWSQYENTLPFQPHILSWNYGTYSLRVFLVVWGGLKRAKCRWGLQLDPKAIWTSLHEYCISGMRLKACVHGKKSPRQTPGLWRRLYTKKKGPSEVSAADSGGGPTSPKSLFIQIHLWDVAADSLVRMVLQTEDGATDLLGRMGHVDSYICKATFWYIPSVNKINSFWNKIKKYV